MILREIFHQYGLKKKSGTYGVEIETETDNPDVYPSGFFTTFEDSMMNTRYKFPFEKWVGHIDNSLRHFGMEYVLEGPQTFDETIRSIDIFGEGTKDIPFIKNTPSTSVHVHINMAEEEPIVLANFFTLYALFENILVDYSGETRRSNLFALPIRAAERTVQNICDLLKHLDQNDVINCRFGGDFVKYAALNIAPLTSLGSIELRSFRGETDTNEIKSWIKIINQLLEFSKISGMTPDKILEDYQEDSREFPTRVFDTMTIQLRDRVLEFDRLIERNLWYAMLISQSVSDWTKFPQIEGKKKEVLSKKKAYAESYGGGTIDETLSAYAAAINNTAQSEYIPTNGVVDDYEGDDDDD